MCKRNNSECRALCDNTLDTPVHSSSTEKYSYHFLRAIRSKSHSSASPYLFQKEQVSVCISCTIDCSKRKRKICAPMLLLRSEVHRSEVVEWHEKLWRQSHPMVLMLRSRWNCNSNSCSNKKSQNKTDVFRKWFFLLRNYWITRRWGRFSEGSLCSSEFYRKFLEKSNGWCT